MLLDALETPEKTPSKINNSPRYTFVCGGDDYVVNRKGKEYFEEASKDIADDFAKEVIEGRAQNAAEVETAINQFISAVQTLSLFGDKKIVWLKGVTFLSDSVTGRSENTKNQLERLQFALDTLDPNVVTALITASPVDRRTKAFKTLQKNGSYTFIDSSNDAESAKKLALEEAKRLNIQISQTAVEVLSEKVNNNTRLIATEITKLATFLGDSNARIDESLIHEMVPQFGENDFFELTEAFFSLDLNWAIEALKRYFFTQKESRPIIAALQNRNRLLIQLRTLLDSGELRKTPRGIDKTSLLAVAKKHQFSTDPKDKSSYNVFTQNPWYLGKLADVAQKLSLKRLIDFQQAFMAAFEGILAHPTEQFKILETMIFKCLAN